jgi:hypothetical protein
VWLRNANKVLRKDFNINKAERETLVNVVYDVTQDFVSSYDFASLVEFEDNDSPRTL